MMEKEYIEREATCKDCVHYDICLFHVDEESRKEKCVHFKNKADVVEVRHGKWISASQKKGVNVGMKCSLCGARIKYSEFFNGNHNYCHKCGAKMDGKGGE